MHHHHSPPHGWDKKTPCTPQTRQEQQVWARLHPGGTLGAKAGIYLPVINVIIFTTPAPVIVWEPVDLSELLFAQGRHTSEILVVRQPGSRKKRPLEEEQTVHLKRAYCCPSRQPTVSQPHAFLQQGAARVLVPWAHTRHTELVGSVSNTARKLFYKSQQL